MTDPDATPPIDLHQLRLGYGSGPDLVSEVDLQVMPGEVVAIVGESGAGKTTLLKATAGLLRPRAGTIHVFGTRRPRKPPRGTIGYIPQRLGLLAHPSALDNVLTGALHRTPWWRALFRLYAAHEREAALAALEAVGLARKAHSPVRRLSGGQQRRVAVARALLQRPRILLADEFLGELDHRTADVVEAAVLRLAEVHGTAIVLVEHQLEKARNMADRVFDMRDNGLVEITGAARARLDAAADVDVVPLTARTKPGASP